MAEEKKFEKKIKKLLEERGAWFLKTFSNGIQRAGVPDLLVCYKGRFIGIEVKAEKGRPSLLQIYELNEIEKAGGYGLEIRPSNLNQLIELLDEIDKEEQK